MGRVKKNGRPRLGHLSHIKIPSKIPTHLPPLFKPPTLKTHCLRILQRTQFHTATQEGVHRAKVRVNRRGLGTTEGKFPGSIHQLHLQPQEKNMDSQPNQESFAKKPPYLLGASKLRSYHQQPNDLSEGWCTSGSTAANFELSKCQSMPWSSMVDYQHVERN